SSADAHAVRVRNPLAAEVEAVVRAEPKPDEPEPKAEPKARQVVWSLGTLKGGASKTLELTLRHKPNATELKNMAYVQFEHGQAVVTRIGKPTLKVSKIAPKQTLRDEAFNVRVVVENAGKVPAENVRVVETLPASAEVEPLSPGARRAEGQRAKAEGQQWEWEIPRLQPGERKVLEYRLTAREERELVATTDAAGPKVPTSHAEARTQVLVPRLDVKLTCPTASVNPGESAKYEVLVRNTGTLPSANIKVTAAIPPDCKPVRKTEGGQVFRDSIVWTVPRLEPGEAQTFRYEVRANTTGQRTVTAAAVDARGTKAEHELKTIFTGAAVLRWETGFDKPEVRLKEKGVFRVEVRNEGAEVARNVRVRITPPDSVSVEPPQGARVEDGAFVFADTIPGYGKQTFTLTFEGKKTDQAQFRAELWADALGDRPLTTNKTIPVTGGR
ncbi:MAG: DUF11 domain-containing protein, partial [Gemmataceae bacterium]|nr:DUF11 domain-containing protein [Gemmataceae bacterium]